MADTALRIEKIGGTSMTRFPEIIENIILKDKNDVFNRVYVVSAYGGVTNDLLEHKKTGRPGIYKKFEDMENYSVAMESLKVKLCRINQKYVEAGLDTAAADAFIKTRIDGALGILNAMNDVLSSGYVSRKRILLAARELLASLGEIHSAYNSANILKNKGYPALFIDLSGWGDGRELTIDQRILDTFKAIDPQKAVCFATGYAKGTEGIMREFDRGYSEVTFSKIAATLKAKEAVIHKEFHLCSGDPNIIGEDKVKPVCNTNFDVADQLADIGMEAIHPKASKPLETAGIPIRIKNAFDPNHPGTLITKDYICPESKTEVVTGSDKVICVEIHDTRMVGEVGFDLKIMQILVEHNVSYISKATNANTIGMVLNESDCTEALCEALREKFESIAEEETAIVCAIGSNIAKPGVMAEATRALAEADINILGVSQTTRQTNMQFIVKRGDFLNTQRVLHRALCE
jgi:aspartate kinase